MRCARAAGVSCRPRARSARARTAPAGSRRRADTDTSPACDSAPGGPPTCARARVWTPVQHASSPPAWDLYRRRMDHRDQRVMVEIARYRITGTLQLPRDGYRSRLTDYLNVAERAFLALTDVEIEALDAA